MWFVDKLGPAPRGMRAPDITKTNGANPQTPQAPRPAPTPQPQQAAARPAPPPAPAPEPEKKKKKGWF